MVDMMNSSNSTSSFVKMASFLLKPRGLQRISPSMTSTSTSNYVASYSTKSPLIASSYFSSSRAFPSTLSPSITSTSSPWTLRMISNPLIPATPLNLIANPLSLTQSFNFSFQFRSVYTEKLKTYKPTTPGIRFRRIVDRSHLWKGKPMRHLTTALRKTGGRNNLGHITVRHRGGGHKRRYRLVDFKRAVEAENVVQRLEYDPNRSAWIALLKNTKTDEYSYILCPKKLEPGDIVQSGEQVEVRNGNCMPLKNMPVGTIIHNIELYPGEGGQFVRSAGTYAQLIKTGSTGYAYIRLPSTEVRMVPVDCRATVGVVSNSVHKNIVLGKAGASRWKGRRPTVRGVAMNPIDHPHGGGEGKGAPGRHSVSPWGKLAKSGKKTREPHKFSNKFVVEPRKRGKNRK